MTNHDDRQHREELLRIHQRNARHLEQQIAQYSLNPPIHLLNALDHERECIAVLEHSSQATAQPSATRVTPVFVKSAAAPLSREPLRQESLASHVESGITRSVRSAPIARRSFPPLHHVVWRARRGAIRWWTAGGIAFALVIAVVIMFLLRPTPNEVLVTELRDSAPPTTRYEIVFETDGMQPAHVRAKVGQVLAFAVRNQTNQPRQWVLLDADRAKAATLLAAGVPSQRDEVRRLTPLLAPGEQTTITFVPYHDGMFTFASVAADGMPEAWGELEVAER